MFEKVESVMKSKGRNMYEKVESFIISEGRKRFPHNETSANAMQFINGHLRKMQEYWDALFFKSYVPRVILDDEFHKLQETARLFPPPAFPPKSDVHMCGFGYAKHDPSPATPENSAGLAVYEDENLLIEIFDKFLLAKGAKLPVPTYPAECALFEMCLFSMGLFYYIAEKKASGGDIFAFSTALLFHMSEVGHHFAGLAHFRMGLIGDALKQKYRAKLKKKVSDSQVNLKMKIISDFIASKGGASYLEGRSQTWVADQIVKHFKEISTNLDESAKKAMRLSRRNAIQYLQRIKAS